MSHSFVEPRWLDPPPDLPPEIARIGAEAQDLTDARVQAWARAGEFDGLPPVGKVQYPTLHRQGRMWDVTIARQAVERRVLSQRPDAIAIRDTGAGAECTITDPAWRNARIAAEMASLAVLGILPDGGRTVNAARRWSELVGSPSPSGEDT